MEGSSQWGRHERVQSDILQGRIRCSMLYQALTAWPVNAAHVLSLLSELVGAVETARELTSDDNNVFHWHVPTVDETGGISAHLHGSDAHRCREKLETRVQR